MSIAPSPIQQAAIETAQPHALCETLCNGKNAPTAFKTLLGGLTVYAAINFAVAAIEIVKKHADVVACAPPALLAGTSLLLGGGIAVLLFNYMKRDGDIARLKEKVSAFTSRRPNTAHTVPAHNGLSRN